MEKKNVVIVINKPAKSAPAPAKIAPFEIENKKHDLLLTRAEIIRLADYAKVYTGNERGYTTHAMQRQNERATTDLNFKELILNCRFAFYSVWHNKPHIHVAINDYEYLIIYTDNGKIGTYGKKTEGGYMTNDKMYRAALRDYKQEYRNSKK